MAGQNVSRVGFLVIVSVIGVGIMATRDKRTAQKPVAAGSWHGSYPPSDPTVSVPPVSVAPHRGNPAIVGGSPTIRRPFIPEPDDPFTTNDESNDQPVGHFGSMTLTVTNMENGNSYTLDGDIDGEELQRLYFPKGGWIDFVDCEVGEDLTGTCTDEEGREWSIEGESPFSSGIYSPDNSDSLSADEDDDDDPSAAEENDEEDYDR